jgi:hypothetical protein
MNIEIPDDTAKLIEGVLASSSIANAPEYIQALIYEDVQTRKHLSSLLESNSIELEKLALEGLDSGSPQPVDSAFWAARRSRITGEQ